MRIVVVGGGLAGGNVAAGLRDEGYTDELIVLGSEPDPPFGRPPLSKTYLRGEEELSGWLVKPPEWYATNDVDLRLDARVTRVDTETRRVVLADGAEVAFDKLCIATGCRPRVPDMPGIDLEGLLALRTKAQSDRIRELVSVPGAKAVVAGMSFIGAEVAASARQLGADVTAIFPGDGPMANVLGDEVAARMAAIHRGHGVELVPGEKVVAFNGAGRVEQAVTESGRTIDCTFAVIGLGVQPNVEFLDGSGIAVDNGVLVDAACRTNVPNVFAAGDVARHDHPVFGRIRVEHYNNAEKQGRYVALSMLGTPEPYGYVHSFWSDQYEHKLEYIGFAKDWDRFVVRGDLDAGFLGFYLRDGVLLAAMGLDRGGDPEAEPDAELSPCVDLIHEHRRVDPDRLSADDIPLANAGI